MAASYNVINYNLRPAKHIERKMIAEFLNRLTIFGKLSSYRYVGFGSLYFTDFILFHRVMGFTDMISIERDTSSKSRFEFNRPFKCVKLDFRNSYEVLAELTWIKKTIIWLDYDGQLNKDCLSDIAEFFSKASSGSVFIISINAEFDKSSADSFKNFEDAIGKENMPIGVTLKDFRGAGANLILRKIINNQIEKTLSARNGVLLPQQKLNFKQMLNFQYADGAKMLTLGGVIWKNSQATILQKNPWDDLSFVRTSDQPYVIDAPCLTLKEIRYLEAHLPIGAEKTKREPLIPKMITEKYAKVYRYYPMYAAAEI